MEPVFEVDPKKLKEPAQYLTALYNIDATTQTVKEMAEKFAM